MRLLNVHSLQFQEFHSAVPRYVIASHRWGDEITMKDILRGRNTDKSGYIKVVQFAAYVKAHIPEVEWLWIDTACLDKKSSQEVTEAVNRMFAWYRDAEVCLAYLPDITSTDEDSFVQSEWWRRGWTLQELLAPATVVFLTQDWEVIGHKGAEGLIEGQVPLRSGPTLNEAIAVRTGIPEAILANYELSKELSVEQKLAWMSGRETTREEDMSYCLYGLLGVSPGANYGEGGSNARRRLLRDIQEVFQDPAGSTAQVPTQPDPELVHQRILDSLHFPGIESRRDQVCVAYHGTYRWTLLSTNAIDVKWDNMVAWLQDPAPKHSVYWVSSKPGAGKSSLIRLLDEEIDSQEHMQPWAEQLPPIKLHFYFWNPGNDLQRSMSGLLRTLLHQIFNELPDLLSKSVPDRKTKIAQGAREQENEITWTEVELKTCFRTALRLATSSTKVLFLIDGLDEIDGDEDTRDELVDFMKELSRYPNCKLILSSRRWTVFQDAFGMCPQLHLEDLNSRDIEIFVRGQFQSQYRYQQMLAIQPVMAERFVLDVVRKAEGVFLWARLVVKALVRSLRDGDSDQMLQEKLISMPGDLNQYFGTLISSIEEYHRWEASAFLQLAMHREREFVTLSPLRLMDLIFIEDANRDFALDDNLNSYSNTLSSAATLHNRLESTLRRLASRCKGLLECYWRPEGPYIDTYDSEDDEGYWEDDTAPNSTHTPRIVTTGTTVSTIHPELGRRLFTNKEAVYEFQIDFMHRSLREYLDEPHVQQFLWSHTQGGPFDARNYLRNARLAQVGLNMSTGVAAKHSLGLASYCISTLSIPGFRETAHSAHFVRKFESTLPYLLQGLHGGERYWYICRSLEAWHHEQSNSITLAIDFELTGYLTQTLTTQAVRSKKGRPLLDYVLRPRFSGVNMEHTIGYQRPLVNLVHRLLHLGADPNQTNQEISIWALFLSYIAITLSVPFYGESMREACLSCLEAMIRAGAHTSLKTSDLSASLDHGYCHLHSINPPSIAVHGTDHVSLGLDEHNLHYYSSISAEQQRFRIRWGQLGETGSGTLATHISLKELLEALRPVLGKGTDDLITLIEQREGSEAAVPRS